MSIALIGLITMAICAFSAFRSSFMAMTALCCTALLGSASAMAFGGANITPGYLAVAFFALAILIRPSQQKYLMGTVTRGRPGIYLVAIVIWAMVSSFVMPRLFFGQLMVFPLNTSFQIAILEPLRPVGANFNQAIYSVAGPLVFALVASLARTPETLRKAGFAIVIAAGLNLVIALIDTVTFAVGMESALEFVRNADYAQLYHHQIMGIKRITGTFPEASAFASTTVMLFAFNLRLWRGGIQSNVTGPIALLSFVAILFSFSSTGYGALIVYTSFAFAGVTLGLEQRRSSGAQARANRMIFVSLAPAVSLIGMIIIALRPELLDPILAIFDSSITNKLTSDSGVERSSWNMAGLNALIETFGLGAGTGSVRTSSFIVSVLANLGLIGAILFALFFGALFFSKPELKNGTLPPDLIQYAAAGRAACFIGLVAKTLAGSSFDLGILFYASAGIACASVYYRRDLSAAAFPPQESRFRFSAEHR